MDNNTNIMKYEVFKDKVRSEVTNLLNNNEVTLSQKRNAIKLMNLYLDFVKSDKTAENLINTVDDFIKKSKGRDRLGVRNVFISITTVRKSKDKLVKLRKVDSVKGECSVDWDMWGRPRICGPSDWANTVNKQLNRGSSKTNKVTKSTTVKKNTKKVAKKKR